MYYNKGLMYKFICIIRAECIRWGNVLQGGAGPYMQSLQRGAGRYMGKALIIMYHKGKVGQALRANVL